ncbi:hypothetical protein VaNZ11_003633 [Volvox africanus]|uniref:Uncharacterized protein n=1 Tax=Volvox africanus TaxID=51714 RepID=A0ABQ5RVI5_9CHLO|nr:hypothetical protein VaNZ11_003633 [Volvox africanus]
MAVSYASAINEQKFTDAAKLVDVAIASCRSVDKEALAQLFTNRGYCQQKVQLYRKALKDYDAALEALPRFALALYRKGQVLAAQKKFQEARAAWHEAFESCNERSDVQLVLDIAAALRDPTGVKVGFEVSASSRPQLHCVGGQALFGLQVVTVLLLAISLAGQYQLLQQAGLSGVIGPITPEPSAFISKDHATGGGTEETAQPPHSHGQANTVGPRCVGPATGTANGYAGTAAHGGTAAASQVGTTMAARGATPAQHQQPTAVSSLEDEECDVVNCVAQQQAARNRVSAATAAGVSMARAEATMQNNSLAIQLAVTQINNGNVVEAEAILDKVMLTSPRDLGARVARGTARALRRDLKGAVEDLTVAIEVEPRYADSWKRRGQARSALGDHEGALADLQKAIDLAPLFGGADSASSRAECWVEKGMIYQKMRDYRRACRDLQQAVKLDPTNSQAWNVLGLCSTSQGDIRDGVRAYEKAVELNPRLKEAWVNMGQALKEEGRTTEAERALRKALSLDSVAQPSVHVMRVLAQMKQQKGEHAAAIKLLDRAISVAEARDEQVIELLYLRAICHHALGAVREAMRDYEGCLNYVPRNGSTTPTEEARQFQFLSFYQKDMALYTYHSLDRKAADFCPDSELPAAFKELWCKKGPPTPELIAHYPQYPPLPLSPPPLPPPPDAEKLSRLTALADQLGVLLQNNHQGFLFNVRQQRAAGYAAVELGQALLEVVAARRGGRQHWVRSEGSSGQAGSAGRHLFGWRDAMDIVVKWRQLCEPNDQVVWVDLLTRREFEQGFGSHTPMFSGQTKCVRYYMNFARALDLQRKVLLQEGHAFDANNRTIPVGSESQREAIHAARTAEDMYQVIAQDSWVVVPIHSVAREGHMLEGTRLTLVRVPNQPDAYEFSIRTPVTPPRWKDFDTELESAFEAILQAFVDEDLPKLAQRILTYCYYWYNFMPLARGTAAVGYTTMLSMFWAAGMPVTAAIPKDYQVDWEAILSQHPDNFIASVGAWLYPPKARGLSGEAHPAEERSTFPPVSTLPSVSEILGSVRHRLIGLNGATAERFV